MGLYQAEVRNNRNFWEALSAGAPRLLVYYGHYTYILYCF